MTAGVLALGWPAWFLYGGRCSIVDFWRLLGACGRFDPGCVVIVMAVEAEVVNVWLFCKVLCFIVIVCSSVYVVPGQEPFGTCRPGTGHTVSRRYLDFWLCVPMVRSGHCFVCLMLTWRCLVKQPVLHCCRQ